MAGKCFVFLVAQGYDSHEYGPGIKRKGVKRRDSRERGAVQVFGTQREEEMGVEYFPLWPHHP